MNRFKTFLFALSGLLVVEAYQTRSLIPKSVAFPSTTLAAMHDEVRAADSISRRGFASVSGLALGSLLHTTPASAKYGASSNMELPNYIDYLIEKNNGGQGAGNALYQGADPAVLLRRLETASSRLGDIEGLVEKKKWSEIQGLLTGPLGTLSQTLNQIATANSPKPVQAASKKLKGDLIAIGQAASKKNGDGCSQLAKETSKDLISFLELAFE